MRKFFGFFAVAAMLSMLSSVPAMAGMNVYAEKGFNHAYGNVIPMNATGHWAQIGNDYGYTLDSIININNKLVASGLIQKGAVKVDDDWYYIDKTTHTIKRNCWITDAYSHMNNTKAYIFSGAKSYFNAEGKLEKIQWPLLNGTYNRATQTYNFDESQAAIYDVISTPDELSQSLIDAVNKYRTSNGKESLKTDKMLLTASKLFSTYLPIDSAYIDDHIFIDTDSYHFTLQPFYRDLSVFMTEGQTDDANEFGCLRAKEFISVGKWDVNEIINEWATRKAYQTFPDGDKSDNTKFHNPLMDASCIGAACYVDANGTPYWYMLIG